MGELDEAIRDHLELKRRRGADPAEVAREEQEALSPVTRGHPVVVPEALEQASDHDGGAPQNGDAQGAGAPDDTAPDANLGDATQEFRVEHGAFEDDWLDDDEA